MSEASQAANPLALLPLAVQNLYFEAGGNRILDGINLNLTSSGISVILGPNGAGKSVLLRLLHGLLAPGSGTIMWGEHVNSDATRKRQALVFQRPVMMRRSVADNIRFALSLRPELASSKSLEKALRLAGLSQQANQPARLLSGGEQQRLAIARSLALEPEVLILDEPSANLDPGATLAIENIIQTASDSGTKIILVTHDLGQAKRLADDIIFMHHGQIVEHTSRQQFFTKPASTAAQAYVEGKLLL